MPSAFEAFAGLSLHMPESNTQDGSLGLPAVIVAAMEARPGPARKAIDRASSLRASPRTAVSSIIPRHQTPVTAQKALRRVGPRHCALFTLRSMGQLGYQQGSPSRLRSIRYG